MSTTFAKGDLQVTLERTIFNKSNSLVRHVSSRTGKRALYCVLSVGSASCRSGTHRGPDLDIDWREAFTFDNVEPHAEGLILEFYDENVLLRDAPLGFAQVPLGQLPAKKHTDLEVPILCKKHMSHKGTCTIKLSFNLRAGPLSPTVSLARRMGTPWVLPPGPTQGGAEGGHAEGAGAGSHRTDPWVRYEKGDVLGQGSYGVAYEATDRATGEKVAVKLVNKVELKHWDAALLQREVQVMHHLAGHPNIVELKDTYEDEAHVYLVMELCAGGELFDAICMRGRYSEKDAAAVMREVLTAVAYCHSMGVVHNDIKPSNFLLCTACTCTAPATSRNTATAIKLTDFGLSHFFKEGQLYAEEGGTLCYSAPEVLQQRHSKEADVWSCGVLLYNLLSGTPPFDGEDDEELTEAIVAGRVELKGPAWAKLSDPAKDCVRRMLERDPAKRATAQEVLCHEWMRERGCAGDTPIELEVVRRLRAYSAMHRLKKEVLKLMARSLPSVETEGMLQLFREMDTDGSGTISREELRAALARKGGGRGGGWNGGSGGGGGGGGSGGKNSSGGSSGRGRGSWGCGADGGGHGGGCRHGGATCSGHEERLGWGLTEADVDTLLQSADTNGDGVIDYGEFLASMVHRSKMQREDLLRKAFSSLDADGSGTISRAEVAAALLNGVPGAEAAEVDAIMGAVDQDGDGGIDFNEFCAMVRAA